MKPVKTSGGLKEATGTQSFGCINDGVRMTSSGASLCCHCFDDGPCDVLLSFQAYELSTLTGTQVLLLVASETGHVYTFATRKLQPMITSETGKALIQTCLNSPDSPPRSDPSSDQRMSATGFEETDLSYQVSEADGCAEVAKVTRQRGF